MSATHNSMEEEWRFDLMIDLKTFYFLPSWWYLEGRRLPIILIGSKPACWHCRETGHLSGFYPGNKAPLKTLDLSLSPATAKGKPATRTSVFVPVGDKPVSSLPLRRLQTTQRSQRGVVDSR